MPASPFRCQVRLTLADLDRHIHAQRTIATAQFADEPDVHILMRFLAWVVAYDDHLADGQGWIDLHQPDLWAFDLTGQLTLWVECGVPPLKRLCKALGRTRTARFVCLCAGDREADHLRRALLGERPRHAELIEICAIPEPFLEWLEGKSSRNMNWAATISDGVLYLDCDGHAGSFELRFAALA